MRRPRFLFSPSPLASGVIFSTRPPFSEYPAVHIRNVFVLNTNVNAQIVGQISARRKRMLLCFVRGTREARARERERGLYVYVPTLVHNKSNDRTKRTRERELIRFLFLSLSLFAPSSCLSLSVRAYSRPNNISNLTSVFPSMKKKREEN